MGIGVLVLGLMFLGIGLLSLKRGRIRAGGRLTAGRVTGKAARAIALPQAIAGGLALVVGVADLAGFATIGQCSTIMLYVLIGTYLATNLGIGGYVRVRADIEESGRRGRRKRRRARIVRRRRFAQSQVHLTGDRALGAGGPRLNRL